jgi:hypothetical protein
MNPNLRHVILSSCLALATILGTQAARSAQAPNEANSSPEDKTRDVATRQLAVDTLGLKLGKDVTTGHRDNFAGLRAGPITFTHRLDSRTYVVYDQRFSNTKEGGVSREGDEVLLKRSRELLERLKVPRAEIASEKVVQESTRVGERDQKTGQFKLQPIEPGKKWVRITRQIDGLPVFSSRTTIGWMPDGEIGFLEVHWPEIPSRYLEVARRFRDLTAGDWHAPELKGARVESVTAGILHSPAAATAMDIVPTIRVIYAPVDERISKKPVAYLDAEGNAVKMPRVFLHPPQERPETQRAAPKR